ncbi:hypothetical protein KPP03845_100475 [Streptomyces xanthophaeus]|uniref:hypothetical protein n=1 Tax=Streptomyces xanthophaeus TaxID=67385 RepID=UPI00233EE1E2|nr:hypothetical protein [Streptomyces xanthophaeus]WCD84155.1 hypothetical protein KPP03845_100475 [Streptomyces xanthophaeus]
MCAVPLAVTACGADKADGTAGREPSAGAPAASVSPAAPPAQGRTDAELSALLVTQTDLPDHILEPADPQDVADVAGSTSDIPACLPVVQAMTWTPIGKPVGTARLVSAAKPKPAAENATEEDKARAAEAALGTTFTAVSLYSYDGNGAQEAFRSLDDAGLACERAFRPSRGGRELGSTTVAVSTRVTAGDEALAYTVATYAESPETGRNSTQLVVVRKAQHPGRLLRAEPQHHR